MKIASVFWSKEVTTGGHGRLLHLLRGLASRGHEVMILTKKGHRFSTREVIPIALQEGSLPSNKIDSLRALTLGEWDKGQLEETDAIVSFGLGGALPGLYLKQITSAPLLLGLRLLPVESVAYKNTVKKVIYRLSTSAYLYPALIGADRVTMQVTTQAEKILKYGAVECGDVSVIRNNIRGSLEEVNASQRAQDLLFVGTLNYRKGVDCLLKAFYQLASSEDVRLHVAGAGPMRDSAESYVREHNIDPLVTFHGNVDDARDLMRQSDLVVIPSRFDSFPNVGLEAMATGTPFIVSDLADLRAAFGRATEYVPPASPDHLAEKLRLLQRPENYQRLHDRCMQHRTQFDFDWVGAFEDEIRQMVGTLSNNLDREND